MNKKEIEKYIRLSYPYIDQKALSVLVSDYGRHRDRLTADLVCEFAGNPAFMAAYAQLVGDAMKNRPFREAMENGLLDFATGTKPSAFDWFTTSTNFLLGGFTQLNQFKWGGKQADAMTAGAIAQAEVARAKIFQYAIIGVVAVVGVIVAIIALKK